MSAPNTIVGLGARTDHLATVPNLDASRLQLSAEEAALLALVGRVERIDNLLSRSTLGEARTIAVLLSLRAKGAIVPARVVPRNQPTPAVDAALAEEVDLEPERKREIIELERSLDAMDYFAVLGLRPGAAAGDVKQAYYNASRRFHPDRYFGKNLGSFRARMERIFRKLTEAHNVLTQQDKRDAYLKANPALALASTAAAAPAPAPAPPPPSNPALELTPIAPRPPAPPPRGVSPPPAAPVAPPPAVSDAESEARRAERQARLARHPYLAKTVRLSELVARGKAAVARGDWERAYQDFHQVQTLDPKNREVVTLLVEARRRHDEHRASLELARGRELALHGDAVGALAAYRMATSLDPQSAEAAYLAAREGLAQGQDVGEVRALAQRAVDLQSQRVEHQLLLGKVLMELGAKKHAKRVFEDAARLDPDNADAKAALKKLRWTF
ncbi:DnaJ domain-containing protein [Myxococcus stipitatus]|uniref:J domain-containing protein n=1 Tax=Myxococcus stipitatus TaxID=83455 RepID=UPI001F1F5B27|nr:J domain-containing protein [Myxococcus stipitatus]MCE9673894.1 DnaJ domain-containing protein [Myxococcus stipitatus]